MFFLQRTSVGAEVSILSLKRWAKGKINPALEYFFSKEALCICPSEIEKKGILMWFPAFHYRVKAALWATFLMELN